MLLFIPVWNPLFLFLVLLHHLELPIVSNRSGQSKHPCRILHLRQEQFTSFYWTHRLFASLLLSFKYLGNFQRAFCYSSLILFWSDKILYMTCILLSLLRLVFWQCGPSARCSLHMGKNVILLLVECSINVNSGTFCYLSIQKQWNMEWICFLFPKFIAWVLGNPASSFF